MPEQMPPERVILYIIGTVVILVAAYYVTYYVGMKASGRTRAGLRNRSIVVRDSFTISRDKSFCVVEIAGKVYIVGTTANSMTLFDTLDAEQFNAFMTEHASETQIDWNNTPVGRYGNRLTKKVARYFAARFGKNPPPDFAASMKEAEEKAMENKKNEASEDD